VYRDRSIFRRALEASLLFHLLVLFIVVPQAKKVWPVGLAERNILAPAPEELPEEPPLEFEFVDLANEREELASSDRAPLSDLDRRAHGGLGDQASDSPGTVGNTPQLVQADGGSVLDAGAPPQRQGPPTQQVPPPRPEADPDITREEAERPVPEPEPEGAGEDDEREDQPQQEPAIQLPPPGAWNLPPSAGGLPENPDREGGRVDEGALSFDTQWYDWGPYAKKMLAKIRRNWRIPEIARLGVAGVVRIRYFIERDGTVTGLQIMNESGKPPMDFAARDAIGDSSPFEPLPSDLTGVDREGVTITFYYNARPEGRR
jgi:TonB family protein